MKNSSRLLGRNRIVHAFTNLLCASAPLRETILFLTVIFFGVEAVRADHWDRFRGPNGTGHADAKSIPSEWKPENFLWKKSLPGVGHSSPVVWDDKVFVTSASPETGELVIQGFDALNGNALWEQRYPVEKYGKHAFNSYASCTPAVDADRIYVAGRDGIKLHLIALTHGGAESWRKELGVCEEEHGFGTSPVVVDDLVCVANDNTTAGELIAFDHVNGDVRWRIPRAAGNTAFATPCLLDPAAEQKQLLFASTASGLTAVNPATGGVTWHALDKDLPQRCVSSPIVAGGMVFVSCGQGGNGKHLIAFHPATDADDAHQVYKLTQSIPNVPTPIAVGDLLFLWHDNGMVSCLDLATGKPHWKQRVGGQFFGSPVAVGDRIFNTSLDGEVVVVAAKDKYELLAKNPLNETCRATPAVANDRMYVRTESSLTCIGEK